MKERKGEIKKGSRDTLEQREARLVRRRQYDRARQAALTTEQRVAINQERRAGRHLSRHHMAAD